MRAPARLDFEDEPTIVAAVRDLGPAEAAAALRGQLPDLPYAALLVFFAPELGPADFAAALAAQFPDVPVYGCTTAGELGPDGITDGGAVAIAFRSRDFAFVGKPIEDIDASTLEALRGELGAARAEQANHLSLWTPSLRAKRSNPRSGQTPPFQAIQRGMRQSWRQQRAASRRAPDCFASLAKTVRV